MMTEELKHQALAIAEEHYNLWLEAIQVYDTLDLNMQDLLDRYEDFPAFTERQAAWIERTIGAARAIKPLYGDFKAIFVMFRLAGTHLKRPKIRLLTKDEVFIQLNFMQEDGKAPFILLYRGGWAGHGQRTYIGKIEEGLIKPKYKDSITPDIEATLQDFSLDPAAVAKASALKLGACSFCGSRLSDPESKSKGYGPVCADHYNLPWGSISVESIKRRQEIAQADDLSSLFK